MSNSFASLFRPTREIGRTVGVTLLLLGLLMPASALAGAAAKNLPPKPKVTQPAPGASKLILEVTEVRCKDETGTEPQEWWPGGDEIAMVGVTIDTKGKVQYAGRFSVGNFEKDGKVRDKFQKNASGKPKKGAHPMATFPLQTGFPAQYEVILVLGELDQGTGLENFGKELARRGGKVADRKKGGSVDDKVKDAVLKAGGTVAASAAVGAVVGGPVGAGALSGGAIAAEIGKALMGDAKAMLKEIWGDDIFTPHSVSAHFQAADFSPMFKKGEKVTKPQTATVKGADGTYQITYAWRLDK